MNVNKNARERFDIFTVHIDTNTTQLSANLIHELKLNVNNVRSSILDLTNLEQLQEADVINLIEIHEYYYQDNLSFVIKCKRDNIKKWFDIQQAKHILNIVPTLDEAIDIVNMEELERDLFADE